MDKKKVIDEIRNYLAQELSELGKDLENATAEKAARIDEIKQLLVMYQFLPVRSYGEEDVVCPGALVELELNQRHAFYLIVPKGGGLVMRIDDQAIQVITPSSPLGEVILGRKVGDEAIVEAGGKLRKYKVVALH